jgi:predicted  nucleic acid-binding Zn-ribbon protein
MKQQFDRLEKLEKLFNSMMGVQPEELMEAVDALIEALNGAKKELNDAVKALDERTRGEVEKITVELRQRDGESRQTVAQSIQSLSDRYEGELAAMRQAMQSEVERVQSLIPELPPEFDASDLQAALEAHQSLITDLSTRTDALNVRNALEVLPEGEKLAIDAIEGLEERLEEIGNRTKSVTALIAHRLEQIGNVSVVGANNNAVLQYQTNNQSWIAGVAITVSATPPSDPKTNDLWVDIS